ncbi:hypothetical protein WN51_05270 [Melipona quadrifasciata]|uniref:Uncharacterized protein n=1 Tax=Melipona quadrifasciata TaxID=166423 RepID=A0A0M9AB35_9HYME|nr:hypothetical protein WN51_05270 [Melipona quadrifasciata]
MAASTVSGHHEAVKKNSAELLDRISMNSCPPSSFPDKFQDFFAALNEDSDDLPSMLEDKLIPRNLHDKTMESTKRTSKSRISCGMEAILSRKTLGFGVYSLTNYHFGPQWVESGKTRTLEDQGYNNNTITITPTSILITTEASNSDSKSRRWSKRAFQRRSSEVEVRLRRTSLTGPQGHSSVDGPKSPTPSRRRSSSIAVARPTPDLHRFLQAEAGPWGHLSPSPRSPTRTPAISPGAVSTSSHLSPRASPGGPSPTTPPGPARSASGSRGPAPQRQYRGRTSSMPAVPRHRDQGSRIYFFSAPTLKPVTLLFEGWGKRRTLYPYMGIRAVIVSSLCFYTAPRKPLRRALCG